jgi:Major Facilitator Superfamily
VNATRRYTAVAFLTWLPTGLYVAPMVLLMLDRGLSVPTIAAIGVAYSLTTAVLELPTGGLADAVGRRGVLLASCTASLISLVMLGFATTAMLFAVSSFLRGVARALGSGPAEAWYVDTVHATQGTDAPIGPGLARGQIAGSSGLAIGTITGGLIPLALTGVVAVPLAIPVLVAAAVEAVRLVVIITAMREPHHARSSYQGVPRTVRDGLRLAWRDPVLARLVVITGCVGITLATIELLTPPWLATVTGAFETAGIAYAIIAALGFAASAVGGALSSRVVRMAGSPARGAAVGSFVMVAALLLLAGSTATSTLAGGALGLCLAGFAYFTLFVGLGIGNPALATLTHARVESGQRATILSVQSLALQAAGALGVNVLSRVSELTAPALAFVIVAAVIGISTLALRAIGQMPLRYSLRHEAHIRS